MAFLEAGWDQAEGGGLVLVLDTDVVGASESAGDAGANAAADHAEVSGADGDGEVEALVFEDERLPGGFCGIGIKPRGEDLEEAIAHLSGFEEAAIEENDIGSGGVRVRRLIGQIALVSGQESGQVTGDGMVGGIREAEFLEAGAATSGFVAEGDLGKETIHEEFDGFGVGEFGGESAADEARTCGGDIDGEAFWGRVAEQAFLHVLAAADENGPGARVEFGVGTEPVFEVMGKGEVEVIAAENEMITDGVAVESDLAVIARLHLDEREIGSTAADIADEDFVAGLEALIPIGAVGMDPGVKSGLRFLEENDAGEMSAVGCSDGEFAGDFVEGSRDGDDDLLFGERVGGVCMIPGGVDVSQETSADFHGRKLFDVGSAVPGENFAGAIDAGMAEPGFG